MQSTNSIELCTTISNKLINLFSINQNLSSVRLKGYLERIQSPHQLISEPAISIGLTELNTALHVAHRIQEVQYSDKSTIRWSGYGNPPCRDPLAWLLGYSGNSPVYKYLVRRGDLLDGYFVPMSICSVCHNDPESLVCENEVWGDSCSMISNIVTLSKTKP
jgi:hypothetical protein